MGDGTGTAVADGVRADEASGSDGRAEASSALGVVTGDQFATLIGTVIAVGAVLVAVLKLIIGREISAKMNGVPQRLAALEKEVTYGEDFRHDQIAPLFAQVQMLEYRMKALEERRP